MCCGSEPDQLNQNSSSEDTTTNNTEMNHLRVETEDTFASLLELAANNDVEGVKLSIDRDPSCVDEPGLWYGRQKGSKTMVNDHRTPLMVAATYGSIDVIKLILSLTDVNRSCGSDQTTALHCAASGGAVNAVQVVKLLLGAGADLNLMDADGQRAGDVIVVPPKLEGVKLMLQELLSAATAERNLRVVTNVRSRSHSPTEEEDGESSPFKMKSSMEFKKEYPVDPSLPDIKNSIYSTDEFRMYSFKVRPCSRAYSHDWTECPFVHPGENARRRDPRKFHYSCVPCPDFRKGACRRGDMCEFAHGVFECWLHPAQYRTRLCKDGTGCARRVCFFAHIPEELRPLYESTGSAVLSPRSNAADYAAALSLLPGSPSGGGGVSVMSPLSPSSGGNGMSSMGWPQPNVPALQLPGSNLRSSSRLRSSFNARDEMNMLAEFEQQQLLNEFNSSLSRSGRMKSLPPSNLEDLFSAESSSSPRYDSGLASAVFSPTHKSAVFNQFQQQQQQNQQGMLSPINTSYSSPKSVDHSLFSGGGGRMSPRNVVEPISPMSSRVSMLAQCVKQQQQQQQQAQQQQQQQFRSLRTREQLRTSSSPIVGSPVNNNNNNNAWSSQWGSSNGKPDWGMSSEAALGKLSFDDVEPDVSWVQSLVKENPNEAKEKSAAGASSNSTGQNTMQPTTTSEMVMDHAGLEAWIEQMQLDQFVAQQN
ncbi:Zinc finger CCCH domain-containing protein 30 [Hirschfeldia incana]|nr:Zinc finger CCCH domain-containing protein 30 [Hirschfeldia incana]